jgi:hypothetical protein
MTMLAQIRQRHHCDKGNNRHRNNSKDACTSTATTPTQWGQQRHWDDNKDTCALMMTTTPLQRGQQCQLEDGNNAITTRATTPSWIKVNNAIVMRVTMPAWQRQGRLRIDNGNNTIVMREKIAIAMTVKTPVHRQQWAHHNKDDNASSTTSNKGSKASSTKAETPVHWQLQWRHCNESNNFYPNIGKMPAHQRQQHHHNEGGGASLTTTNEGNNTSLTTMKMPTHQRQQWCHQEDGNDACASTMAKAPFLQGQRRQLNARWTTCEYFFLGRISFLSKTALSQASQQGKEGLDKGDCTDSSVAPNNYLHYLTGWVKVASPPEGERATLAILVWPQTLACFSRTFLYFVLYPTEFFLAGNEYLGVKKDKFTPYTIVGGLAKILSNFQMTPIPILSVLTCSTSSPYNILKVSKKINHNLPVGRVKRDIVDPGGFTFWFFIGFWLDLILNVPLCWCCI